MEQLIFEIQKMQQGNFQDYESFYNLSAGQIYAQIKALVPDDETAQQVLTDTYNQIYADIGGLSNPEAFYDWAAQIVQAKVDEHLKSKKILDVVMLGSENTASDSMASGAPTVHEAAGNVAPGMPARQEPSGNASSGMPVRQEPSGNASSGMHVRQEPSGNASSGMQVRQEPSGNMASGTSMGNGATGNIASSVPNMGMQGTGNAIAGDIAASAVGISSAVATGTGTAVATGLGIGAKIGIFVAIVAAVGGGIAAIHHFSSDDADGSQGTIIESPTDATSENETTVISTEELVVTTTEEQTTEITTEETTEATTEEVLPQADYRSAYIDILNEKKYSCGSYNWQYGYSYGDEKQPENKPVSLFDVNGDGIPELFVFYATESYVANMDIYTVDLSGEAKLLYSGSVDVEVAAGTSYCIFMTEDGKIYHVTGIGDESYTISYYEMLFEGDKVTEKLIMTEHSGPNEDYSDTVHTYTINEKKVSAKKFKAERKKIFDSIKDVIQYNYGYMQDMEGRQVNFHNMTWGEAYMLLISAEPTADKPLPISGDINMYLSSGVGAWGTSITIHPDGTFEGNYHDSDMGVSGEGYDSTIYICNFSGKFKDIKKVDEYTYSMQLDFCKTDKPKGEEWIEEMENARVRYVASEAYGIEGGKEFEFYLPGKKTSELEDTYISWIYGLNEKSSLDSFGLYNVDGKMGFGN